MVQALVYHKAIVTRKLEISMGKRFKDALKLSMCKPNDHHKRFSILNTIENLLFSRELVTIQAKSAYPLYLRQNYFIFKVINNANICKVVHCENWRVCLKLPRSNREATSICNTLTIQHWQLKIGSTNLPFLVGRMVSFKCQVP